MPPIYTLRRMLNKRKSRELSIQLLFLWDANNAADLDHSDRILNEAASDPETRAEALSHATAAWEHRAATDAWLTKVAPQWPSKRQPGVDRAILRLAVWEMTRSDTPPKVVIDEAIELAKSFSTENSPAFVNGVLDAVLKETGKLSSE